MKHPVRTLIISLSVALLLTGTLVGAAHIDVLNGAALSIWGGSVFFGVSNNSFYTNDDSYEKSSAGSVNASQVNALDIQWECGDIRLETVNSDEIRFSEESSGSMKDEWIMRWKLDGGVLKIRFGTKRGIMVKTPHKTLTVQIPASLQQLSRVELDSVSANAEICALRTDRFVFDTVSGRLHAEEGITAGEIDLNGVSGDMDFRAECNKLSVDTVSGNVKSNFIKAANVEVDCVSGDVTLRNSVVSEELSVDTTSGDLIFTGEAAEIELESTSGDANLELTAAPRSIEVDTTSGDVTVTLPADITGLSAELDSVSGELSSDFGGSLSKGKLSYGDGSVRIEMDSTSGDLFIRKGA